MSVGFKPPPFGKFANALNAAADERPEDFRGGVTLNGEIVVTSWTGSERGVVKKRTF